MEFGKGDQIMVDLCLLLLGPQDFLQEGRGFGCLTPGCLRGRHGDGLSVEMRQALGLMEKPQIGIDFFDGADEGAQLAIIRQPFFLSLQPGFVSSGAQFSRKRQLLADAQSLLLDSGAGLDPLLKMGQGEHWISEGPRGPCSLAFGPDPGPRRP